MKIILLILSIMIFSACDRTDFMSDEEKEYIKQVNNRKWNTNSDGVEYFKTIIEGQCFIATRASHGSKGSRFLALAGPIEYSKCIK